jgi:hypothetical protein
MTGKFAGRSVSTCIPLQCALSMAAPEMTHAPSVPAHGYLLHSTYGTGWACDRGYRTEGASCVAVELPQNAHLDYSGNDWDCDPPHQQRDGACVMGNRTD